MLWSQIGVKSFHTSLLFLQQNSLMFLDIPILCSNSYVHLGINHASQILGFFQILKILNSNTENPYLIWDNSTRTEVTEYVSSQQTEKIRSVSTSDEDSLWESSFCLYSVISQVDNDVSAISWLWCIHACNFCFSLVYRYCQTIFTCSF